MNKDWRSLSEWKLLKQGNWTRYFGTKQKYPKILASDCPQVTSTHPRCQHSRKPPPSPSPIIGGIYRGIRSQDFVLNMDQIPVFFSMVPRTTLQSRGSRMLKVRISTSSMMRVTVTVTVSASGKMLQPMMVYKGRPGSRIEREFPTYHRMPSMQCRIVHGWMSKLCHYGLTKF